VRTAVVGGAAYAIGRSQGRSAERSDQHEMDQDAAIAAQQQAAMSPQYAPPPQYQQPPPQYAEPQYAPPAAAPPASNLTQELSRLADLRASGVLTDAEFQAAKAQLLGS
jgi:hypothetical protein